MQIGYASMTKGVRNTNFKSTTKKYATEDKLYEVIRHNLETLDRIIEYNIKHNIKVFRISSDIIPFGSSDINTLNWSEIFKDKLALIGSKINEAGIRVSMHPGQYTVLNSNSEDVVKRAIEDLEYHAHFLESLNTNKSSKIILHIGGVYGDKEAAIERFINNYQRLNKRVTDRLIIENDDVSYNIEEVLYIANRLKIPVVYDNLHNEVLCADKEKSDLYWIDKARKTWDKSDGGQKIHYSQQDQSKRAGAHSKTINLAVFLNFIKDIDFSLDIMLEVKDKNLSALKCINATKNTSIINLEVEWSKFKYLVLEKSPQAYNEIRELLKDKETYPVEKFYQIVEDSLKLAENKGYSINAFDHVWGYFKKIATDSEKRRYKKMIIDYKNDKTRNRLVKNFLERLAIKYKENFLLDSYFFIEY